MSGVNRSIGVREALGVLGVGSDADPRRLRSAYLTAVKAAHPDRAGGDAERLRRVVEAYETLRARRLPEPQPDAPRPEKPARPRPAPLPRLEITIAEAMLGGVRMVTLQGGETLSVRLPPGLRVGDKVGLSGTGMAVAMIPEAGAAVIGDHLCLTVPVERAILADGGRLTVETPGGPMMVRVSRQDATRGLVRVADAGLPARGRHAQGHLFVRLEALPDARFETPARAMLRRFTAVWAA
jgi:curved DNA-binding protein